MTSFIILGGKSVNTVSSFGALARLFVLAEALGNGAQLFEFLGNLARSDLQLGLFVRL